MRIFRALRQVLRQKFAAASYGNAPFKESALKKTRKSLALLFKTIYNKSRQSDIVRHAGDVVFGQFFLRAGIYGRGEKHARGVGQGFEIPVLSHGDYRLAGLGRRARRDIRQRSGGGHARHALRRKRRRSLHRAFRSRLSRVCFAVYALSFRPCGDPSGNRRKGRSVCGVRQFFCGDFCGVYHVLSRVALSRADGICLCFRRRRIAQNIFRKGKRLRRLRKMPWWKSLRKEKYPS